MINSLFLATPDDSAPETSDSPIVGTGPVRFLQLEEAYASYAFFDTEIFSFAHYARYADVLIMTVARQLAMAAVQQWMPV